METESIENEDFGRIKLKAEDMVPVAVTRSLLTDNVTTGYLNLLGNTWNKDRPNDGIDFNRSAPDVIAAIEGHLKESHSGAHAMDEYSKFLLEVEDASAFIRWEHDKLVYVQVFQGPRTGGHWTGLMLDRTRGPGKDIAVYFDSLGGKGKNIEALFRSAGIIRRTTPWLNARVPQQYGVDCGVYMCLIASAYLEAIEEAPPSAKVLMGVDFCFTSGISSSKEWGKLGRQHILRTIENAAVDYEELNAKIVFLE